MEYVYGAQSRKKRRLLYESVFVQIERQTLILKNGWKKSFSYKTKALVSFIQMRRMSLWFLIMKRKEIITWIHVYANWEMNFDSRDGGKWSFSYETKVSISFVLIRRICSWCLIMERKEIIAWVHVSQNWHTNFNSIKWWKMKHFAWNQGLMSFMPMSRMSL